MKNYQLPEAIERLSAETIRLEEESRAWQDEVKHFQEITMRCELETEALRDEMQTSQLTDEEPDNGTQNRLAQLMHFFDCHPKFGVLVFQDDTHFHTAVHSVRRSGSQIQSKLHIRLKEVPSDQF